MTGKLISRIPGGAVIGAAFRYIGDSTNVGILVCTAAGAAAAGVSLHPRSRKIKS